MSRPATPLRLALRRPLRALLALPLLALALPVAAATAGVEPVAAATLAQRAAFRQAWAATQHGGQAWHAWDKQLAGYPLYPYLEAAALTHDLPQVDRAKVEQFLQRYPDSIPATDLRRDYLQEAARRQDWPDFLALYQAGLGDALTCDRLQASLADGDKLDFQRDLAGLWDSPSLPSVCNPVLDAAHAQGLLTDTRLWSRVDRALATGQAGTIASLAQWLPAADQVLAEHLAQALRHPAGAAAAARHWSDVPRNRQAAALAVQRLARHDSDAADSAWQRLQSRLTFSATQRAKVQYALALFHATDFDAQALRRLAELPDAVRTNTSREWRARVALARQDWDAVLAAITAMPDAQQQDGEWRYFHARALAGSGHPEEAQALYAALAREPTYFGFLAADRIGSHYTLCPLDPPTDPQREQALRQDPGLIRAFELYAVGLPRAARREWTRALDGRSRATRAAAAELAYRRGWYDRAVFTFSSGPALHYYAQRFPLASQDGVVPQAKAAGIDPAWAYAIARAESAWMSDAHSGADARGLMQLLPSTAARVAQRNDLPWTGADSLYDPAVNIALGTRYLAWMAARFNGAPWLASAAYNAGAHRVEQWLQERGALDPDLFVATMPFHETRDYVARVMAFAVIYDWRLGDGVVPMSARMPPIGQAYAPPGPTTPHQSLRCSTPAPAGASAATAAAARP